MSSDPSDEVQPAAEPAIPGALPGVPDRNGYVGLRRRKKPELGQSDVARAVLLGIFLTAATSIVLIINLLPSNQVSLNAGDVASADIAAPFDLTYESEIRTRQARDAEAASVSDIYDPPDPSIARQQEVRAKQILDYVGTVRQDPYASPQDKGLWLAAIPDLSLSTEVVVEILDMNDTEWQLVRDEVVRVLIQAMQGEIRDTQVPAVRRRIPTLIGTSLSDEQAQVVEAIAGGLVTANIFFNAARTEEARQQARDSVQPMVLSIRKGEAIVRQGNLVQPQDIEKLDAFGLRQGTIRWQEALGTILFAAVVTALLELFLFRLQPTFWTQSGPAVAAFLLIVLFVIAAKLMLTTSDSLVPYYCPLPALAMILTVLSGPVLGLAAGVAVGLIGAFMVGGSLSIVVYILAGTLIGMLALGRAERMVSFLQAGLAVALTNAAVLILFGLLAPTPDLVRVSVHALVGVVMGGLAASLALAAFFALSSLLGVVTPFQLMELSRPTQPLFRRLLLQAPGTYYHTLLVSNMAEEAADRIGADALLTRVGAYYHDIGKTVRPYFFSENRVGVSANPHDRLDPNTSAQIVISHVQDGLDLAEKYRLPAAIRAFIPEHQGTGLALAFYRMAVKAAGDGGQGVREEEFRYPGPLPQRRETAIVMLADSCEARVRSMQPGSVEEIDRIIRDTIKTKLDEGQLDESDLTLRDLTKIREAFLDVLQGVFHPRVKYPDPVKVRGPDGQEIIR